MARQQLPLSYKLCSVNSNYAPCHCYYYFLHFDCKLKCTHTHTHTQQADSHIRASTYTHTARWRPFVTSNRASRHTIANNWVIFNVLKMFLRISFVFHYSYTSTANMDTPSPWCNTKSAPFSAMNLWEKERRRRKHIRACAKKMKQQLERQHFKRIFLFRCIIILAICLVPMFDPRNLLSHSIFVFDPKKKTNANKKLSQLVQFKWVFFFEISVSHTMIPIPSSRFHFNYVPALVILNKWINCTYNFMVTYISQLILHWLELPNWIWPDQLGIEIRHHLPAMHSTLLNCKHPVADHRAPNSAENPVWQQKNLCGGNFISNQWQALKRWRGEANFFTSWWVV